MRLPQHYNPVAVDERLLHQPVERRAQVARLMVGVALDIAAALDVHPRRLRKAAAHRNCNGVTAPHQFARSDNITCPRLKARIAERFPVIDQRQGKRAITVGLEDRRFELHAGAVTNEDDLFVERMV